MSLDKYQIRIKELKVKLKTCKLSEMEEIRNQIDNLYDRIEDYINTRQDEDYI